MTDTNAAPAAAGGSTTSQGASSNDVGPFGAVAGAAPVAGTSAPSGAASQAQAQAGAGQPYYPDKLPEHLRGASDRETLDKVFGAYSGFRDEQAKRGAVPKTADEYKLELSPEAKATFGDPASDPRAKIFKSLAHKHGLTDKQAAGVFAEFHAEMIGQNLVPKFDPAAEIEKLAAGKAGLNAEQKRQEAASRWKGAVDWADGLVAQKTLSKEQATLIKAVAETADGVMLIEALRGLSREHGLQTGGAGTQTALTKADLDRRTADPRNSPFAAGYDPAFRAETDRLYQQFYSPQNRAA